MSQAGSKAGGVRAQHSPVGLLWSGMTTGSVLPEQVGGKLLRNTWPLSSCSLSSEYFCQESLAAQQPLLLARGLRGPPESPAPRQHPAWNSVPSGPPGGGVGAGREAASLFTVTLTNTRKAWDRLSRHLFSE